MKNIFKSLFFAALAAGLLVSCVDDDETALPPYIRVAVAEDFNAGIDNTLLELENWTNYAESGTVRWKTQVYSGNGYAEFNPFSSGEPTNVGWLITPSFNLVEGHNMILKFQSSQSYVTSAANSLEILISTDFDGTNVAAATWTPLQATTPGTSATYFEFINSGEVDLSNFSGEKTYIAFKVKGSGSNTALDGSYQIDNVAVFPKQ